MNQTMPSEVPASWLAKGLKMQAILGNKTLNAWQKKFMLEELDEKYPDIHLGTLPKLTGAAVVPAALAAQKPRLADPAAGNAFMSARPGFGQGQTLGNSGNPGTPSPTPTTTPAPTPTPTPTTTPAPKPRPAPTPTQTPAPTPGPTRSPTPTATEQTVPVPQPGPAPSSGNGSLTPDDYVAEQKAIVSNKTMDSWEKRLRLQLLDEKYGFTGKSTPDTAAEDDWEEQYKEEQPAIAGPDGAPDENGINPETGRPNIGGYDLTDNDLILISDIYSATGYTPMQVARIFIWLKQNDGKGITADELHSLGIKTEPNWMGKLFGSDPERDCANVINMLCRTSGAGYSVSDIEQELRELKLSEAVGITLLAASSEKGLFGGGKKAGTKSNTGANKAGKPENKPNSQPVKYQRTQAEFDDLATDPGIGGKITPKTIREREVGLGVESTGKTGKLVRDKTGAGDFIDSATGQMWDVKGFNSNYPPEMGGYTLASSMKNITKSLGKGENVIVDTLNMSPSAIYELKSEIEKQGLGSVIIFWP